MHFPNTVWITGASSGIGRELAIKYAKLGSTVYASARNKNALKTLVMDTETAAGNIISTPLDVTDDMAIDSVVAQFRNDGTTPDLCILNAGYYKVMEFDELNLEHFADTFSVNYTGVIACMLAVLPQLMVKHAGHIAVVSSVAGYSGLPNAAAYGSSKAALINLCESLRHDFINHGLQLTIVNPGFVKTPMTDKNNFKMPFLLSAENAADRTIKGLASSRFEVTFPRRFTWLLKCLRLLPYPIFFWLTGKLT